MIAARHLEYASVLKHPKRPDFLRGMLTQESSLTFVSHLRQCRPLMEPAEPPRGKFFLTGCPECSNASAMLYFTHSFERLKSDFDRTSRELQFDLGNMPPLTPNLKPTTSLFSAAVNRVGCDPKWLPEKDIKYLTERLYMGSLSSGDPEVINAERREETAAFLLELWNDTYGEVFDYEDFFGKTSRNHEFLCIAACEWLEYEAPHIVVDRVPLKVFKLKDSPYGIRSYGLISITAEEKEVLESRARKSRYSSENLVALGVFDKTLAEDSFPEMWPLAFELLSNDSSMSINQAVLSARLLASPEF